MTQIKGQLTLFSNDFDASQMQKPSFETATPETIVIKRPHNIDIRAKLDTLSAQKLVSSIKKVVKRLDKDASITNKVTLPEGSWHDLPFLCIDTETSGLDFKRHRVIEIGWVLYHKGIEFEAENHLCAIAEPLHPEITALTGISNSMLVNEQPFLARISNLFAALEKAAFVVAYNAGFDRAFVTSELKRCGLELPDMPWVDPCVFIKEIDRYQKGKKLTDAAKRWGVSLEDAHRALADARATGQLLYRLVPHLKVKTLQELIKQQKTWASEQEKSYQAYLANKKARDGVLG
jgi:DNA polymerase III epsilon subunit-like protein